MNRTMERCGGKFDVRAQTDGPGTAKARHANAKSRRRDDGKVFGDHDESSQQLLNGGAGFLQELRNCTLGEIGRIRRQPPTEIVETN